MASSIFKKKTFCLVTGASRGYGKCIAEKFASMLVPGSSILLLARSLDKLQEVSSKIKTDNPGVSVLCNRLDQSDLNDCSKEKLETYLLESGINSSEYDQAMIIHNAGTTGDLTKFVCQMSDRKMVEETMNTNVTGTILLNASFMSVFTADIVKSRIVINVSSLAAIQPFSSWSLYCTGKAARDMFFSTLAKEDNDVRVLNYAPGPLDTDMQKECRQCGDEQLRQAFTDMWKMGKLLTCEESVDKLITLLEKNTFESGLHIDFYDV